MAPAAALALGLMAAAPAAAEGATGTYTENAESGHKVYTSEGNAGTSLFILELEDGSELLAYCIDFQTRIRQDAGYAEDDWASYPGAGDFAEPGKVLWVLQNGYPTVEPDALAEASGVEDLSKKDALSATQAAIWYFSNDLEITDQNKDNVLGAAEYLVDSAEAIESGAEPDVSLKIDPDQASGLAGETIGEFTVSTSAESVPLVLDAPEGVELVDMEGNPVESAGDGDVFGFSVPEDTEPGKATVNAATSATVHTGRLFRGTEEEATQTLITAQSQEVSVEKWAKAKWEAKDKETPEPEPSPTPTETPEPTPPEETPPGKADPPEEEPEDEQPAPKPEDDGEAEGGLPVTGAALGGLVAAAAAALGGGGLAMYLARKRRSAAGDLLDE